MIEPMDFEKAEREVRALAAQEGVDLDAMLEAAGRHFASPTIVPYVPSDEEIDQLVADEIRSLRISDCTW